MTDTQVLSIVVAVCTLLLLISLTGICWVLVQIRDDALDYFAFDIAETEHYHEQRGEVRDEHGRWVPRQLHGAEHAGQPLRGAPTPSEHTEDAPKAPQTAYEGKENR